MGVTKKAIHRKSASHICCKESNFSLHASFSRGERLIVLHAGSKAGFLKGTELVWKAKSSTGDYQEEMIGDNFFKWVKEKLNPFLSPKSVLISTTLLITTSKLTSAPIKLPGRQTYRPGWQNNRYLLAQH